MNNVYLKRYKVSLTGVGWANRFGVVGWCQEKIGVLNYFHSSGILQNACQYMLGDPSCKFPRSIALATFDKCLNICSFTEGLIPLEFTSRLPRVPPPWPEGFGYLLDLSLENFRKPLETFGRGSCPNLLIFVT